jgi:high-affinity Fe2+/Pb2+ permease
MEQQEICLLVIGAIAGVLIALALARMLTGRAP